MAGPNDNRFCGVLGRRYHQVGTVWDHAEMWGEVHARAYHAYGCWDLAIVPLRNVVVLFRQGGGSTGILMVNTVGPGWS